MQSVERRRAPDERRRVIRRIALVNADVRRLEHLAQGPEGDLELGEAYRSVRILRRQLAWNELETQRAELDRLAAKLAELGDRVTPDVGAAPRPAPEDMGAPNQGKRAGQWSATRTKNGGRGRFRWVWALALGTLGALIADGAASALLVFP